MAKYVPSSDRVSCQLRLLALVNFNPDRSRVRQSPMASCNGPAVGSLPYSPISIPDAKVR